MKKLDINKFLERRIAMEEKELKAIRDLKDRLLKKYEASGELQARYKSFEDYLKSCLDRAALKIEYDKSLELQKEFKSFDRFVAYVQAEIKGLVKIIGQKIVTEEG